MVGNGNVMKPLRYLVTLVAVTVFAFWAFAGAAPDKPRTRTVAFDNVYGNVKRLQVHVVVDGAVEQTFTAKCDAKTCSFKVPLTNARHELMLSVNQDGKRSSPTRVTLDTSGMR